MKELSRFFSIIAVDSIGGSGKSEANSEYLKSFDQIKWIDEIMDALQLQKTYICGVSYGAYLSYYYTLRRPERIIKAICLAGRIPSSQFEVFSKMMTAFLPEALFPSEKSCKKLLRKLTGPNFVVFEENEELMRHWYYLLKYFNNRSMMQHKISIIDDSELHLIREKVMFLIGEHDRLSNYPTAIRKLGANHMNYKLIKAAGHAINHEQSELINQEIINYFNN